MKNIKHIFFHLVDNGDDPFYGIKKTISKKIPHADISDMSFSTQSQKTIQDVEYSKKLFFRFYYYRKVFKELKKILKNKLSNVKQEKIYIYISDEGFWPDFILSALKKNYYQKKLNNIYIINVQHGFFDLEKSGFALTYYGFLIRKFSNFLSSIFFGYNNFGYGFFRSNSIYKYLVYSNLEKDFINNLGKRNVLPCQNLIKTKLKNNYQKAKNINRNEENSKKTVLIIMPYFVSNISGIGPDGTLEDMLFLLKDVLTKIINKGFYVCIRFHPGTSELETSSALKSVQFPKDIYIDKSKDISEALSQASFVAAFGSTVLIDAKMLGIVPINIYTNLYKNKVQFQHELIDCENKVQKAVETIFTEDTILKYKKLDDLTQCSEEDLIEFLEI
tara:strand:+ start:8840 stop:10006 length:1167 start_codon:yes stop_codon:yes gene_type:complete